MRIGFFGGAFDPYHQEHENVILQAKEELGLDRVIVYPSSDPPHKTCSAPFDKRVSFLQKATKKYGFVTVDTIEGKTGRINPTVEILPKLQNKYPAEESYFIIGGDSLEKFDTWIRPQEIADKTQFAVIARGEKERTLAAKDRAEKKFGARITVLRYVGQEISSSLIKAHIELGDRPSGLSNEMYDLIREEGLYHTHAAMVERQKGILPPKRYEHVKRTTYYALKLNGSLGLPYEKVFPAAFLHDCAKMTSRKMEGVPDCIVHQFVGREIARTEYGIEDEEILSAIECHTTGKPNMTTLEKLIFCADMLEEGRTFAGVETLREIIKDNFEKGFFACVQATYKNLTEKGKEMHPLTKQCLEYYNNLYL